MMPDASAAPPFPCSCSSLTKALDPERAMVPKFDTSSPRLMPRPVSSSVIVPPASSVVRRISRGRDGSAMAGVSPATWRCRSFSKASCVKESECVCVCISQTQVSIHQRPNAKHQRQYAKRNMQHANRLTPKAKRKTQKAKGNMPKAKGKKAKRQTAPRRWR